MAAPTVLGVMDTDGLELIHPMRAGRGLQQRGRKGRSNHRWMVDGKLLQRLGLCTPSQWLHGVHTRLTEVSSMSETLTRGEKTVQLIRLRIADCIRARRI
jgi:hypothetical protein